MPRPRQLLLIDAAGAAVTSLMTALVLAPERLFATGIPPLPLYLLAVAAAGYCLFGTIALVTGRDPRRALRFLAPANLAYGAATAALCVSHWRTLSAWGGAYFAGEILILVALAAYESNLISRR